VAGAATRLRAALAAVDACAGIEFSEPGRAGRVVADAGCGDVPHGIPRASGPDGQPGGADGLPAAFIGATEPAGRPRDFQRPQ